MGVSANKLESGRDMTEEEAERGRGTGGGGGGDHSGCGIIVVVVIVVGGNGAFEGSRDVKVDS